jgi:outer membrane protein assembly factor BamB
MNELAETSPGQTEPAIRPNETVSSADSPNAIVEPVSARDIATQPIDWPMFRGNHQLTGVAAGPLPDELSLLWTYASSEKNDAFESSPAIVDGVVYAGSASGFLHAVGLADGKLRWKHPTGEAGVRSSPAVADGKVFFGDDNGVFRAVAADSGEMLWKYETLGEVVSSPNVIGNRVLFASTDANLYCLAAADGKLIWQFKTEAGGLQSTPAVVEGKTFVSGCDSMLRVIDVETGKEIASVNMEGQTGASPAVLGDRLFVGHFGNQVLGIDWKKPEVVWRYEHPERQFPFYSSPAATADRVIIGGRDKMVHCLNPQTGEARWTFTTKGKVDSSPVIVGTRVFVGSHDGNVYALGIETGEELWRFTTGGPVGSSPAIAVERLVIGNEDGKLFCFGTKQ